MSNNTWCCLLGVSIARTSNMLLIVIGLLLVEVMVTVDLTRKE